jgi:hypothetical protein
MELIICGVAALAFTVGVFLGVLIYAVADGQFGNKNY